MTFGPGISIHALLAESDLASILCTSVKIYFYPRSPCGERRRTYTKRSTATEFLSTLSLRRATYRNPRRLVETAISIHALLAESDSKNAAMGNPTLISIHALLAESDTPKGIHTIWVCIFLSTLSLRRATQNVWSPQARTRNFYPRSPCGERRFDSGTFVPAEKFLSTLSLRRATITAGAGTTILPFLSTLSLRRATYGLERLKGGNNDFYPRSPCGERPAQSTR